MILTLIGAAVAMLMSTGVLYKIPDLLKRDLRVPMELRRRPPAHLDGSLRSWAQACIDDKELKWDKKERRWRRELPRCEPTEEVCP